MTTKIRCHFTGLQKRCWLALAMDRFVRMAGVGSHMSVMETVESRGGIMPEVIAFVSNKGLTNAAGIIEEIIVAPIAVIIWAVIAVVITAVVHRATLEQAATASRNLQPPFSSLAFEHFVHFSC